MAVELTSHLTTSVEETKRLLHQFARSSGCFADWSSEHSRVLIWRDVLYRGGHGRQNVMKIRVSPVGEGSHIRARAPFGAWIGAGIPVAAVLGGLIAAWAHADRDWGLSLALLALIMLFCAFPLYVYLRERQEARELVHTLSTALSDVLCPPPTPPPTVGPYR